MSLLPKAILIRNGTVVNDDCIFKADVLIEGDKIVGVEQDLQINKTNCEVIDATDRYVIPGGIDPHTHMQMPFMGTVSVDDFFHGTRAALAGGTTMGLIQCARIGALARVHAENGSVIAEKQQQLLLQGVTGPEGHTQSRPEELEAEATNRACVLAAEANCPLYVVHVMSVGAAETIMKHRQRGRVIFGEPIAAGLALDGSHYYNKDWTHAAAYVLSPPLSRHPETRRMLMELLASGELHLTATDNCTFTCKQKRMGRDDFTKIPNGLNGVEDRMSIVWEKGVAAGIIDPMKFVAITSTTAAKIFNIYPRKGRVQVGSDADLVIWNAEAQRTISAKSHHHAADFNVYEGMVVHGVAEVTISRGRIVWCNGKFTKELVAGSGRFVSLAPNCDYVFGAIRVAEKLRKPTIIERVIE